MDEESISLGENLSTPNSNVAPASLSEVGQSNTTGKTFYPEPRTLTNEINESLDQIEIFVDVADMEMQSSFTGMASVTPEGGKSATKSGTSGKTDLICRHKDGGSHKLVRPHGGIEEHSCVKSSRLEKRHGNRSKDRRRSSDADYHQHRRHRRRITVSCSPPHGSKTMESQKGRIHGYGERRSPSEPFEKGCKSGGYKSGGHKSRVGHKRRLVEKNSVKGYQRQKGHKSEMYSDKLESTSKVSVRNQRLSSCTSISAESEDNYHPGRHHHHQGKYKGKKTKKWKKDKIVSKKKLIADPRNRNLSLEWDQKKHDSSISQINGNKSRGKDHVTQEDLVNETHAIEEEIRSGKREILKSSLRKERIELLHRNVHGTSMGDEIGGGEGGGADMCLDKVLRARLAELDEEIIKEKRQLLLVMKRMEQRNLN